MSKSIVYACDRCTFAQYHPCSYCPRCPGRLHRREFPSPGRFETEAELVEHLKSNGIDYIGEYPRIPQRKQLEITIQRYEEKIVESEKDMSEGKIKNKNWNPVKYWTGLKTKVEEELAQLGE